MNQYVPMIVGLIIVILIIAAILIVRKDNFVYDPMSDTPEAKVSLTNKPKLNTFFDAVSDGENSFTDKRFKMRCAGCVNSDYKSYFKPITPRNCILCHDFVNGKALKLSDRSNGVL